MNVKVKICGIRTLPAALGSIKAGADFLGFNFVKSSKRYIDPFQAKEIIECLPASTKIVGVFQDEKVATIKQIVDLLKLDFVQLHGSEGAEYSRLTQYAGVIKTFSLESDFDSRNVIRDMSSFDVDYFLVDRKVRGEGDVLNFYAVARLSERFRIILSGGLDSTNVREAVRVAHPVAVDVAGGVETDGVQEIEKIGQFIRAAKGVSSC